MLSFTRFVLYRGVELEVTYDYAPPEARSAFYPGCAEEYITTRAMAGDVNILPLLNEEQILEIEQVLGQREDSDCWRMAA
ncbi:hypothetical protein FNU76_18720 [Chitinimonas arctica]|uniref:Uncharacterized protein n=1 Tax=Chitinimonas arctica TaxID=2594795 RepID=A0A516SJ99_9NEIS|nr:hypothetical protein [Chitinimonas arctica]QDQ28216.1 hypothetical protein FNU76_18720 [Chitinimonas arctica]